MAIWKIIILVIVLFILLMWFVGWVTSRNKKSIIIYPNNKDTSSILQPMQIIGNNEPVPTSNSPLILYLFYNSNCGPCARFKPIWDNITNLLESIPSIKPIMIECSKPENEALCFYYNIRKTPTIILVTPNKNIEYVGQHNLESVVNFINTNLNEHINSAVSTN